MPERTPPDAYRAAMNPQPRRVTWEQIIESPTWKTSNPQDRAVISNMYFQEYVEKTDTWKGLTPEDQELVRGMHQAHFQKALTADQPWHKAFAAGAGQRVTEVSLDFAAQERLITEAMAPAFTEKTFQQNLLEQRLKEIAPPEARETLPRRELKQYPEPRWTTINKLATEAFKNRLLAQEKYPAKPGIASMAGQLTPELGLNALALYSMVAAPELTTPLLTAQYGYFYNVGYTGQLA